MVSLTKEDQRVHFFLASSEQFFIEWLDTNEVAQTQVTVIGDLTKLDAQIYFEYLSPPPEINFPQMFELTGSYMFIFRIIYSNNRREYVFH